VAPLAERKEVSVFFLIFTALSFASSNSLPEKFFEVVPGLYRSAQPQEEDFSGLVESAGIKSIVNLNNDESWMELEREITANLGITLFEHPMSGFWSPTDEQVDTTLMALNNPQSYPVLLHCLHGEDRTGLIIGLYRVIFQNWSPQAAYQEMLDRGFHPILLGLDAYFWDRTQSLNSYSL
jgi:protein tyrosine/serine phosphatase